MPACNKEIKTVNGKEVKTNQSDKLFWKMTDYFAIEMRKPTNEMVEIQIDILLSLNR